MTSPPPDDVEDPVANTVSILSATNMADAIETMSAVGLSDAVDSLSDDAPDSARLAVRYLESYVDSHPDIDTVVDRGTERAALLGFQASKSGRDEAALETFLRRRWGLPITTVQALGKHAWAEPPVANPLAGLVQRPPSNEGWVPDQPPASDSAVTEVFPAVQHQGYNEAFEQARQEGYFGGPTAAGAIESGEPRE